MSQHFTAARAKGRFTAEAKAQAANAAKLGPLLPEFAEGLAQVIIVGRITTGKTARVEVLQHCVAIAESGVPQA